MAHPMMGMLKPQMGNVFDDLAKNLSSSLKTGLSKAQQTAVNSAFQQIASNPTVQNAVVESGNDAAIQSLAQQLKTAQMNTATYVKANPWTSVAVVGAVGVGLILLVTMMRR